MGLVWQGGACRFGHLTARTAIVPLVIGLTAFIALVAIQVRLIVRLGRSRMAG